MKLKEFFATLPSYCWLLLFFLVPTLMVFAYALKPYDVQEGIGLGWTLETITSVFTHRYIGILWRTIWLSSLTTAICLAIALPLGYGLVRASPKMQKLFLLLVIMPFWSSFLVRIFAWKTLLHPEGFIKQALTALHIIDQDTLLLYNLGTVLVVMVYSYLPFAILPVYAQSVKFNFQLIEAAMDSGATQLRAFFSVFLPSIRKSIFTAVVMVFIPAIGAYVIPDVVGGSQCEMIGNVIAQKIFVERNLPQASALSAILCLLVMLPLGITTYMQRGEK